MSGDREVVELQSLTDAIALLDRWIAHASQLEADIDLLQRKYAASHERCEQLREIVSQDYPPVPF